jgi:hypothetical protein
MQNVACGWQRLGMACPLGSITRDTANPWRLCSLVQDRDRDKVILVQDKTQKKEFSDDLIVRCFSSVPILNVEIFLFYCYNW